MGPLINRLLIRKGLPALPSIADRKHPLAGSVKSIPGVSSLKVRSFSNVELVEEEGGGASTVITFTSRWVHRLKDSDLLRMREIMGFCKSFAILFSHGPLTLKMLKAMGHPYGFNGTLRNPVPRQLPKSAQRHVKGSGIRGSVPNLTIVNIQTGDFEAAWASEVYIKDDSIVCKLSNSMEYAWYLAGGTTIMQAHGPFSVAVVRYMSELTLEKNRLIKKASRIVAAEVEVAEA